MPLLYILFHYFAFAAFALVWVAVFSVHPPDFVYLIDYSASPGFAHSFGFVDPALVVRTCHLIPMFSLGKSHSDGIGLSSMSKDGNDWKGYYINRYFTFHWLFFL